MQDISIKDVLVVRKSELKAFVRKQLLKRPELVGKCTNRTMGEAMIFIEGYASAIENELSLPIIEADLKSYLLEQGLNYIIRKIG